MASEFRGQTKRRCKEHLLSHLHVIFLHASAGAECYVDGVRVEALGGRLGLHVGVLGGGTLDRERVSYF